MVDVCVMKKTLHMFTDECLIVRTRRAD